MTAAEQVGTVGHNGSKHQRSTPLEPAALHVCLYSLQAALNVEQQSSAFRTYTLVKVMSALHVLQEQVRQLQQDVVLLEEQVAVADWLAMHCAPARKWLVKRADSISMPWCVLEDKLHLEEDLDLQPYTDKLKASLQHDDYSWEDWLAIQSIADAGSPEVYMGKKVTVRVALQNLESEAHCLPASVQHLEAPLRKAFTSLINR